MAFPTAHSQVYYNEAGEPLGWDTPSDDPPDVDDYYEQDLERTYLEMTNTMADEIAAMRSLLLNSSLNRPIDQIDPDCLDRMLNILSQIEDDYA